MHGLEAQNFGIAVECDFYGCLLIIFFVCSIKVYISRS